MNIRYLFIICFFLLIEQHIWGDSITKMVHFSYSELMLDSIRGEDGEMYIKMSYPGTDIEENLGFPALPIKYVTISLPHTADDISLDVQCTNIKSSTVNRILYPIQEPQTTSSEKNVFKPCDISIYQSAPFYPLKRAKIVEISCSRNGDKHVVVEVCPVVYYPREYKYDFCEDINLILSYKIIPQKTHLLPVCTQITDIGIPYYEYCIITNQHLKSAFTRLIAWKREKGLNAGVICKEDILNNPLLVGDTVSSIYDDAGKIRQYLQYAYASGVTKYVLFGGNDQILPIRYGTGNLNASIPSDLYFSELNSNWNKNGNLHYGESNEIEDYGSELYVGRILCTNSEEIRNYTDKLLRYELNPGNGDYSYLQKALYTQADQMQKGKEQNQIAERLHSVFPIDTIFSENPSYDAYYPTSPYGNDIIAEMNNHYGYVSWGGHGAPTSITVKTGGENGNPKYAITSVQADSIPWITSESANGLDNLNNKEYPMFAYSISCTITPFDAYYEYTGFPSIGQSFTLGKDFGGPVLIGNTRVGYVGYSKNMQIKFNDYLLSNPMVGPAQNYAKMSSYNHHLRHSSNIIGCPNIRVWMGIPSSFSASLTYDSNNYIISANGSITDAEIGIRNIMYANEDIRTLNFNPSQGPAVLSNTENNLITLTGKNCLPQILPMTIQNATLQGTHYIIVKDVICGKDVRIGTPGDVVFTEGSDYTFETNGVFVLTKNVEIRHGAKLEVIPSEINY